MQKLCKPAGPQRQQPLVFSAVVAIAAVLAVALAEAGCDADDGALPPPAGDGGGDASGDAGVVDAGPRGDLAADATGRDLAPDVAAGCRPGPGVSGSPNSISQVVQLVNSLPRPVTVACFLESLDRPLYLLATSNSVSLQPAVGRRSPRLLLIAPRLIMTLAPAGSGSHTIEFGEFIDLARTVKGEIGFPIVDVVGPADPYLRIHDPRGGTTCRGCHRDEAAVEFEGYPSAFASGAMRPQEKTHVDLDSLLTERDWCDASLEPDRCAILHALFDHGPVVPRLLPTTIPTIFD